MVVKFSQGTLIVFIELRHPEIVKRERTDAGKQFHNSGKQLK